MSSQETPPVTWYPAHMQSPGPSDTLRVLLLSRSRVSRATGSWEGAPAAWSLGAFTLKEYLAAHLDGFERVDFRIRSFPAPEHGY